jgi:tetratricopeptide (TPR) repeat protein
MLKRWQWRRIIVLAVIGAVLFLLSRVSHAAQPGMARVEKLFLQEKYDGAVSQSEVLIDSGCRARDEVYYIKGLSELKLGRYNEARRSFGYIISRYRSSARTFDAYIGIGDSYLLEGNTDKAIVSYNDVFEKFPGNKNEAVVHYRLADCYRKLGAGNKAKEFFDKARRMSPFSFEARSSGEARESDNTAYTPKASTGADLSVQVGCFKNKRNAERLAAKLSDEGYKAYVDVPPESGDNLYRVKAGRSLSKDEAAAMAARLRKDGYHTRICGKE